MPTLDHSAHCSALSDEVLRLLALRESEAVPQWAAGRLAALCGATQHRVLCVLPIAAARRTDAPRAQYAIAVAGDHAKPPIALEDDEPLRRVIRGRQALRSAGGRWLLSLRCGDEVRYVIELLGIDEDHPGQALAAQLMSLVSAYYDLLADTELDPLTRLANRRMFYSQAGSGLASSAAAPSVRRFLAVADIDHFKTVNDSYGHLYGDEILIHFARLMRRSFRATDMLYRFGGEEFVMVFGVERDEHAAAILERFRRAVAAYDFPRVGRITISIGFTAIGKAVVPVTTLVDQADQAVYYAKRNGRNRVCAYEALVAEGAMQAHADMACGDVTLF